MIRTDKNDEASMVYLDLREARRLENAEYHVQAYEYDRERFDNFPAHVPTLAEVIQSSRFFAQPITKRMKWSAE